VPFAHDQFDNAERVSALGAGEVLHRSEYSVKRAVAALHRLMNDPAREQASRRTAEFLRNENGAIAAADAIERVRT